MRARSILKIGLGLTLGFLGAIGAPILWMAYGERIQEYFGRRSFDAAVWQNHQGFSNDLRIRMVDDLLRRYSFEGLTREQVIKILGEPDDRGGSDPRELVYWLGPQRGAFLALDSELLVFSLDEQMKVSSCGITHD